MWTLNIFAVFCFAAPFASSEPLKAVAVLRNPAKNIDGVVMFEQTEHGVIITGNITGLTPGLHGFHVHEKGDVSDPKCLSAGGHFNPYNKTHGKPDDETRHVGDLGNLDVPPIQGPFKFILTDSVISLKDGETNIVGRSLVVHEDADDYGRGSFTDSNTTGHAGARLVCGVIEKSGSQTLFMSSLLLFGIVSFTFLFEKLTI